MSFGQREKVVFYLIGRPVETGNVVAFCTIGGKTGCFVVGVGGGRKIGLVTIDTVIAHPVELQARFRFMAVGTSGRGMCANERETVVVVEFGNIIHQPVLRTVAPGTVIPDGSVVDIRVAGNTGSIGIREDQAFVAGPAIHPDMLARERKTGFGMAEPRGIPADLPARCF